MVKPLYVVLGASGWVGHYLVPALRKQSPEAEIVAVYGKRAPSFSAGEVRLMQAAGDYASLLALLPPCTLLHLARGEEEKDFDEHRRLIKAVNEKGGRYLYASSFNAVDADISRPHRETDPPASQSDYGKHKARCEEELAQSCRRWVAFRFAATHGFAPNREARTQAFLSKLKAGETVPVQRGIRQNRAFVGDLAAQIALLASQEAAEGVFHLGTRDASDEVDFLRLLAGAFGYGMERVEEAGVMDCNAEMLLDRLPALFPAYRLPSECDTIARVAAQPELSDLRENS